MQTLTLYPPLMSLDPKRIAGYSATIALHVAVLMALMLPMQTRPPSARFEDPPLMILATFKPIRPVIPPNPRPRTITHQSIQKLAEIAPMPPFVPFTDSSPLETLITPDITIDNSVNVVAEPVFAQLTVDVAPPPPYPMQALRRGLTGLVLLRVQVDESGQPVEVLIEHSSGSTLLDNAALKHVLARWHFIPATQGGNPIQAWARVPINFTIDK